jgi:CheY-like chemotaxis protein
MAPARKTALLVEDEPMVAAVAADALDDFGYAVVDVTSAQAALEAVRSGKSKLDFAIVDLGLPDRPGQELIVELRQVRPDLPIIIATGYGAATLSPALKAQTQMVVLSKPYDSASLQAAIDKLGL